MKRWSALLLLMLLPLTMAPRTSLDPMGFEITVWTPRHDVRVGAVMPIEITVVNADTEASGLTPLVVSAFVDEVKESTVMEASSQGCVAAGDTVGCWVPPLEPGEQTSLRMSVSPLQAGELVLHLATRTGQSFGTVERTAVRR